MKTIRQILLPAVCGIALCLVTTTAYAGETRLRVAQLEVKAWTGGAQGSTSDPALGSTYRDLLLNSEWRFTSDGRAIDLSITRTDRSVYRAQVVSLGDDGQVQAFLIHGRNPGRDRLTMVDGLLLLQSSPSMGLTMPVTFTEYAPNGETRTIHLFAQLLPAATGRDDVRR